MPTPQFDEPTNRMRYQRRNGGVVRGEYEERLVTLVYRGLF